MLYSRVDLCGIKPDYLLLFAGPLHSTPLCLVRTTTDYLLACDRCPRLRFLLVVVEAFRDDAAALTCVVRFSAPHRGDDCRLSICHALSDDLWALLRSSPVTTRRMSTGCCGSTLSGWDDVSICSSLHLPSLSWLPSLHHFGSQLAHFSSTSGSTPPSSLVPAPPAPLCLLEDCILRPDGGRPNPTVRRAASSISEMLTKIGELWKSSCLLMSGLGRS
jgi:hypothetical protein